LQFNAYRRKPEGREENDMKSMIDNLVNGNIAEAKKRAKHRKLIAIYNYLLEIGYTENKAMQTASFLKGETDYQTYCDAA
jgi:DNA polymerase III delta prime subunit